MGEGKILVVDDSPLVRKLAEISLQEAGYEVYTANNGEEGLKIAETVKPDLILVDFIMPKMTGSQLCKLIREHETLKDVPIILITGKGETVGQTFIEKYKVLDYFIKPFKSEDLVEKVKSTLHKIPESYVMQEEEIKELEEIDSSLNSSEVEEILSLEDSESLQISDQEIPEETKLNEEVSEELTGEVKAQEIKDSIEMLEQPELQLSEDTEISEIHEIEDIKDLQSQIEETSSIQFDEEIQTLHENVKDVVSEPKQDVVKSFYDITEIEKLIENKLNMFSERFISAFDTSVEKILKKYGLIKDPSLVLSGNLKLFKLSEIFALINSNKLTGLFGVHDTGIVYEFLFVDGQIIYGISDLQKRKLGFKLLNEFPQDEIKNITSEAISSLIKSKNGTFIFESKQFSDSCILNRTKYNPLEFF